MNFLCHVIYTYIVFLNVAFKVRKFDVVDLSLSTVSGGKTQYRDVGLS